MLDTVKDTPGRVTGWWSRFWALLRDAPSGLVDRWTEFRAFLTDVRAEMKRVTWPAKKEVYATTIVVILTSIFFGIYLGVIDFALDRLMRYVLGFFGAA
jgi:preprotein translocase subunit SecE